MPTTVLVVDDDELVRAVTVRMAKRLGYDVLEANAMNAALALSQNHAGAIELLLSDMDLGDGDGLTLAEEIKKQRPAIRSLLMSGSGSAVAPEHGVLEKPFTYDELGQRIRELLGG